MRNSIGIAMALMLSGATAWAGHNGSSVAITAAVQSGSVDSIVAEIERAELLPDAGAIPVVTALIDHPSARVREAAGWWISRRGVRTQVIATCTQRLQGQDPTAAGNCGDVLRGLRDPRTLAALSQYLAAPLDEASGASAARAIGTIGDPSVTAALNGALRSPLAGVRAQAAASLRDVRALDGAKVAATAAPLLAVVNDADPNVRLQVCNTLGFIGQSGGDVTGVTAALSQVVVNDTAAAVRKAAAWALGQLKDGNARAALTQAQNDADPLVRSIATAALANLR